jgi:glycerol-1-phosphatase
MTRMAHQTPAQTDSPDYRDQPSDRGPAGPAATGTLEPGSAALAARYDVALLDLDGVVYRGSDAVPGAAQALAAARDAGMRLAFVTNNASRSPSAIAAQLSRLGVPAQASDVVTSAQAAATLIAQRFPAGSPVLVAGAIGLRLALRERGLRPVSVAADNPVAVVQGYAPDMNYGLLAEAGVAVRDGAWYVATNADSTLPTPRGPQPGNGSLLQVIITATGIQPVVAGKPETPLHAESIARTGAQRPLVIGDRLDTDIEGAVRGGADSLVVLTGVSDAQDVVLAPAIRRPTYVAADLGGLLEPQPVVGPRGSGRHGNDEHGNDEHGNDQDDVDQHGTGAHASSQHENVRPEDPALAEPVVIGCGGWQARRAPGEPLELTGNGAWIDGLRALCAAAWSGQQADENAVASALKTLGQPH